MLKITINKRSAGHRTIMVDLGDNKLAYFRNGYRYKHETT
jgi:hypothetical protein